MVYDNGRKNIKITIFSEPCNILDNVTDSLLEEAYNVVTIETIDKLTQNIIKGKAKIIVVFEDKNLDKIISLDSSNIVILLNLDKNTNLVRKWKNTNVKIVDSLDELIEEMDVSVRIVNAQGKVDFQKYKMNLVSSLVESITHNIQANLLLVGASMDVVKMLADDEEISKNKQKKEVLDSMVEKNSLSLDKANMLLEILSNATSVSNESVMQCSQIEDIIRLILDEYIKENSINVVMDSKIRNGVYICGPLNDIVFILCSMIKSITDKESNTCTLEITEDANYWYLKLKKDDEIEIKEEIVKLLDFITYIKFVKHKVEDKAITLVLDKIKE